MSRKIGEEVRVEEREEVNEGLFEVKYLFGAVFKQASERRTDRDLLTYYSFHETPPKACSIHALPHHCQGMRASWPFKEPAKRPAAWQRPNLLLLLHLSGRNSEIRYPPPITSSNDRILHAPGTESATNEMPFSANS